MHSTFLLQEGASKQNTLMFGVNMHKIPIFKNDCKATEVSSDLLACI